MQIAVTRRSGIHDQESLWRSCFIQPLSGAWVASDREVVLVRDFRRAGSGFGPPRPSAPRTRGGCPRRGARLRGPCWFSVRRGGAPAAAPASSWVVIASPVLWSPAGPRSGAQGRSDAEWEGRSPPWRSRLDEDPGCGPGRRALGSGIPNGGLRLRPLRAEPAVSGGAPRKAQASAG